MTKNSPPPGTATTRRGRSCSAMVCQCPRPTKQPDQEDKEAAARGATCVPTMSSGIHTPTSRSLS